MTLTRKPGAFFLKVPKLFGRISGDIILFVSSKRRRLEAQNFAVIFIFIPFPKYEKTSLQNKQGGVLQMAFRARKVFGTFEKRSPGHIVGTRGIDCNPNQCHPNSQAPLEIKVHNGMKKHKIYICKQIFFFCTIVLKGKMQSNRKFCCYQHLCEARRRVFASFAYGW